MTRTLTASDRSALIKMASKMPVGSPERKAILAGLSKSASLARPLRLVERELMRHPAFIAVLDSASNENVFAFLVEYAEDNPGYEGGIRVEVYDENGDLITEEAAPRGERTNLRPYVKDAQKDWNDAYRSASGRASGRQKEARFRQWGKSASADVMHNWRSKDTPAEQRESLGQAMADAYEVLQTVLMLAKKTEGADPQSVNKALRAVGAAMFGQ